MAGPIGYGVSTALRQARARGHRAPPAPPRPLRSWAYFVALTALLSWMTAAAMTAPRGADGDAAARLLDAALWYAAAMGWQPLLAAGLVRWAHGGDTDTGLRAAPLADVLLAAAIGVGCAAAAAALALLAGEPDGLLAGAGPRGGVATAAAAAIGVLWLQAMTEEYGWRGAPLVWAVEAMGPRRGLLVHGAAWGLWYAPLFLIGGALDAASAQAAAGFVATCAALGVVLGWLRLRSRSLVPPAVANVVLTLAAGLPVVLYHGSVGARDAVFRWPGWPVLGLAALAVLVWRRRELEPRT